MSENILTQAVISQRLALRQKLAAWSDRSQGSAVEFVEKHRDLLGRKSSQIGTAQLSGFNNMAQAAPFFEDVLAFIRKQGDKARRSERSGVAGYWEALEQQMQALKPSARILAQAAGLPIPAEGRPAKEVDRALNPIYLLLAREWAQHMVTHSIFVML